MIEKIIIPNLERCQERRWANRGALIEMGVPNALIEYFPARDCQDYVGRPAEAVAQAEREGWHINRHKARSYLEWPDSMRKWFCMRWTFVLIFKRIMEEHSDGYFVFLVDDHRFCQPYEVLLGLLEYAVSDANTRSISPSIIQLHPWETPNEPLVERHAIDTDDVYGSRIARGLRGSGDVALVLNKTGAAILFERMCVTGGSHSLEGQLWFMAKEPDQTGFYSILESNPIIAGIYLPNALGVF